jgi:hypothetical protein
MNKRNALAHYQAMETQARLAQALREVMVESGVCNWDSAGRPWLQRARNALFNFELFEAGRVQS